MLTKIKNLIVKIKTQFNNIETLAKKDLYDLWTNYRVIFVTLGGLIILIKFREILITLLINSAKALFQKAENKNNILVNKENSDNAAANALVNDANNLPNTEGPVSENWYKNQK